MKPDRLGRYQLIRVLGKGAMGIVYEGRDPNLDRRVAIKTVRIENLNDQELAEYEARFTIEARSAARMQHPNIVGVYDSGRDGDLAYLVMEYVEGKDLKHHMDQGARYTLAESLAMTRDLLDALDYSHLQGILHRDIKPANLLLDASGQVKLTDFGVARMQDSTEATRTHGGLVGTLKYMSPEQVQGQKIDHRSDLFSAGIVLYQLLTNVRPFDGDSEYTIIQQILGDEPAPPSTLNPALPRGVDALVGRALAKDRNQRFQSAHEFADALHSAVRQSDDTTVVPPLLTRRNRREAGAGTGSRGLVGTGGSGTDSRLNNTGSTITQELELVYWKDVRESDDSGELETFLQKFPQGLYADLARRRLRLLRNATDASGGMATLATGPDGQTWAKTQLVPGPSPDASLSGSFAKTIAIGEEPTRAMDRQGGATAPDATADPPGVQDSPAQPPAAAPGAEAEQAGPSEGGSADRVGNRRQGMPRPSGALIGIVLLTAVAGAGYLFVGGRSGPVESVGGGASAPLSAGSGPEPSSSRSVTSPLPTGTGSVAPVLSAASAPASTRPATSVAATVAASSPLGGASGSGVRRSSASTMPMAQASSARASSEPVPVVRPAAGQVAPVSPSPNSSQKSLDPNESCKGRVLLGLESCLKEQCETASSRDHPVCKQRREWEAWRQESDRARRNQ